VIGATVKTMFNSLSVERKVKDGNIQALNHAAAAIRLTARRSIRRSDKCSDPGTPPNTRKGQLREAILYAVEKENASAVIGPTYEAVGLSATAHEFGGMYMGSHFPIRAFMGPALEAIRPRLPDFWLASVK
jgi:phage gpG-like protein